MIALPGEPGWTFTLEWSKERARPDGKDAA